MADVRHVVEIILKARDDTQAAMRSALENVTNLEEVQERGKQKAKEWGDSFERATKQIKGAADDATFASRELRLEGEKQLAAQQKLERASAAYAKAVAEGNVKETERIRLLGAAEKAQKEFEAALVGSTKKWNELGETQQKWAKQGAASHAARIREINEELARIEVLDRKLNEAAKSEEARSKKLEAAKAAAARERAAIELQMEREVEAERKKNFQEDQRRGKETQRSAQETARAQARALEDVRKAAQNLSKTDITPQDFDKFRRELIEARRELTATGVSGRESMRQVKQALDQANASISEQRRLQLQSNQAQQQHLRNQEQILRKEKEYEQQVRKSAEAQALLSKARQAGVQGEVMAKLELRDAEARAKLQRFGQELRAYDGRTINIDVDIDTAMAELQLRRMRSAADDAGGGMRGLFATIAEGFSNSGNRIAAFDNLLRGLLSLGIALFLGQLIQLAGAAAGAFLALASSAAQAGAALGGALVAGIAQAIPALGVLATALNRVKQVSDAVKQANLLQQQQSAKTAQTANQEANAIDGVRAAQEALANAQRGLATAQRNLSNVRAEGRRELQLLILAEREAMLAARGAALSQEEAQEALAAAVRAGQTGQIQQSQLGVDQARLGRQRAGIRVDQAREGRAAGTGDQLRQAQEAVADAERAVANAERGLARARRSAATTGADMTAAAGKLNFLLAGLSGAERRLYRAILNLGEVWTDFSQNAAEPLINSFTRAVRRITAILQMDEMVASARLLSTRMGAQFNRLFDHFTSPRVLRIFRRLADQAGQNLKPLFGIIINLGDAFLNIAEAAGPAFTKILRFLKNLTGSFKEATGEGKKTGALGDFFLDGVKHLKAWVGLIGSFGKLFLAIMGPGGGAKAGIGILRDFTGWINKLAKAIEEPDSKANKFFRDFFRQSRRIMGMLGPILTSLANEFDKTFNKAGTGSIEGFVNFMSEVAIPALGKFVRTMMAITSAVGNFVSQHPQVAAILSSFLAFGLVGGVLGKLATLFSGPVKAVRALSHYIDDAAKKGGRFAGVLARMKGGFAVLTGPIGLVVGIVGFLLQKMGLLDDVGRAFLGFFKGMWEQIRPPFERLWKSIQGLVGALGDGEGGAKGLFKAVRPLMKLFIDIAGVLLRTLGAAIGKVFGGLIDVISGVIDVVTGILTGDWRKAWDGFKRIISGALRAVWGLIETLFTVGAVGLIRAGIRGILGLFASLGGRALSAISNGFKGVMSWFGGLPGRIKAAIGGIGAALGGAFTGTFDGLKGAFKEAWNFIAEKWNSFELGFKLPGVLGGDKIAIGTPNLPILRQHGGPIPGYGGGDRVSALLEPGEHVLTKEEVARAGGHGAIFALRAILGGGGQGKDGRFRVGGEVGGAAAVSINLSTNLGEAGQAFRTQLRLLVAETRGATNEVAKQFREMRVGIERTMLRLSREFHQRWFRMSDYMHARLRAMVKGASTSVGQLSNVVYKGMRYVGSTTNSALEAFDADPVRLDINPPSATRAATGYVGQPGERGKDAIMALVGRGEAVLNHWQQRAINSLLPQGLSVQEIVKRTRGYHAGGPGAPGFAGGYAGKIPGDGRSVPIPGAPGEFIAKRIAGHVTRLMRRYKMAVTDGFATSGHSRGSDHYKGLAVDFVPGAGGNWNLVDQAAAYAKSRMGKLFRWIGYDGTPGHGRGHHLHLSWLSDVTGLGGAMLEQIKRLKVSGTPGNLKRLAQAILDRGRKGANKALSGMFDSGEMEAHPTEALLGRGDVMSIINRAMNVVGVPDGLRAAWRSMAYDRARQESGFNPNAVNRWDINAQRGDPSKGLFQTIGATFRSYMQPGMNNILNPLHNTVAAFNYMFGRYGGGQSWQLALQRMLGQRGVGYATGGIIPGDYDGAPQPILAHAGEWILNKGQQAKLASLAGLPVPKIKAALGFSGGPTEFQGGGEVSHHARRMDRLRRGIYTSPLDVQIDDFADANRQIGILFRAIRTNARRVKAKTLSMLHGLKRFNDNIEKLTEDEGLISTAISNLETQVERRMTRIRLAVQGLRRRGIRGAITARAGGRMGPEQQAQRELAIAQFEGAGLADIRQRAQQGLGAVEGRIARIRRGGVSAKEKDEFQRLLAARNKLIQTIDETDAKIAENYERQYELRIAAFEASTEAALKPARRGERLAELALRAGEIMGLGAKTMADLQQKQIDAQKNTLAILGQRMREAEAAGFTEQADALREEWEELAFTIAEAAQQRIQTLIDGINRDADRASTRLDIRERIATALGNRGALAQIISDRITNTTNQIADLRAAIRDNPGMSAEARADLELQIESLQASVTELVQQQFQARLEEISRAAERRERGMGLRERLAAVRAGFGDAVGAAEARAGVSRDRGASLLTQQRDLQALLEGALAMPAVEQNQELIQQLRDQIEDLGVSIEENTLEQRNATNAIRQARIDQITQRDQFRGGIFGSLRGIAEAAQRLTGQVDPAALIRIQEAAGAQLRETAQGLRAELRGLGLDLTGLSGQALVDAVMAVDWDALTAGMTDEERQTFEGLVNAVLANEQAMLDNTNALNELNGTISQPQGFSSTAWSWFREAIFTGMGDVLPQYQVPAMQSGGAVTRSGLFQLHAGEFVVNPQGTNAGALGGDINIEINEAGGPLDVEYLANRLAFEKKSRSR